MSENNTKIRGDACEFSNENSTAERQIAIFEEKKIRREWDEENQDWYFSIVDVCEILAETDRPRKYWNDLKKKLIDEGSELSEKIGQLKMQAADGKYYNTDVMDTEQLLRLVQSIPSKKAEPFKMWLAQVGAERMDEIADPELAIDRAFQTYFKKGYSEKWINQRIKTMEVRNEWTNELKRAGIQKQQDYATLTDIMTKEWSGKTTREYKVFKDLRKENLRDNMTNMELVLNMLAEVSATGLSKESDPIGMTETKKIAKQGGSVAKAAREQYEKQSGKKVITSLNAKNLKALKENNNEE